MKVISSLQGKLFLDFTFAAAPFRRSGRTPGSLPDMLGFGLGWKSIQLNEFFGSVGIVEVEYATDCQTVFAGLDLTSGTRSHNTALIYALLQSAQLSQSHLIIKRSNKIKE